MTGLARVAVGLSDLIDAVPYLDAPVLLLEGGRGGGLPARLAFGARRIFQLDWNAGAVECRDWIDSLPCDQVNLYGFISYDLGLPGTVAVLEPALTQPLAHFFEPAHEIVLDRTGGIHVSNVDTIGRLSEALSRRHLAPERPTEGEAVTFVGRSLSEDGFVSRVERVKQYIAAGDVYQVNLAVAEYFETVADPWDVYRRLRDINPSPWMGFADFGGLQLVSGSPELLLELCVEDGVPSLRSRPIAGTRKKTGDPVADDRMRTELQLDEKERAEHRMLVDLVRNDIGRVAAYGTVKVTEREVVEEYSHVFHLVSQVEGEPAAGSSRGDAIQAAFPGGTITGAPKISAMEIIAELEPVARGAYTGAMGWIGPGGFQLNILIRTLVMGGGRCVLHQGAGIVWDSVPEREWKESLRKGGAVRRALGVMEQ